MVKGWIEGVKPGSNWKVLCKPKELGLCSDLHLTYINIISACQVSSKTPRVFS